MKEQKNLLLYSFKEVDKQTDEINKIINEVKKTIEKPDLKLIEQMKEDKEFFSKKKFITSEKALQRLSQLINAIKYKIPIIEEGPTGTSKTFTTLIAIDYLNYRKKKENPDDKNIIKELLRFNLSSQTRSDDLLCQIAGDPDSPAGLKTIDGVFLRAFRDGYPLLLDEINLANESVLQFLLEAINSGVLSIIINGKGLEKINMHEDFCLIATQNPPTGMFAGKRNTFSIDFLSKFSKVKFEIDLEELKEITKGSAKEFNYNNEQVIDEMVRFHEKWVKNYVKDDDVQCFTIRDILATIKLISENKGTYESINSIYGARYPKKIKLKLQEVLKEFPQLSKKIEGNQIALDENFPFCYTNELLINTINQCIFSLENGRNIIISGSEGCGKSFLAKMISKYFDLKHFEKNQLNNITNYCICTNKLECSDLLGSQKPSDKIQEGEEMLVWKNGFLTEGIKNGYTVVLDNINEAPSTVTERLNGLLDKTYDDKEAFFELPENPNESRIKINTNFRIICVCEYDKIKKMSPAFINRFDVIVLDDLFDKSITDEELKKLTAITLVTKFSSQPEEIEEEQQISEYEDFGQSFSDESFSNMSGNDENEKIEKEAENEVDKESDKDEQKKDEPKVDLNKSQNNEENQNQNNNNSHSFDTESKKSFEMSSSKLAKIDPNSKEKDINIELKNSVDNFLRNENNKKFLEEIIKAIRKIEKFSFYNITKLINATDTFCQLIQKENRNIEVGSIINFTYDLIFSNELHIENLNIDAKIMEFFDDKLDEKDGHDENDDNYHFKESESLRKFIVFLLASSYINLHLCVIGPPGGGKTTSARAFSRIRGKILDQTEVPFRMYTFNEGTKPHDFYGSSTLNRGKIKFNYGALTHAIRDGSVFIADEFNLSSIQTMRSILPALEHNFNKRNRIPGVEGPIIFNNKFFFIICQNESMTLGRNLIPKQIENRLRTIYYPPAEIKDIKEICKNINEDINDSLNVDHNSRLTEDDAKRCGEYMMKLNNLNQRILSPWSLRDIHKLFSRIANIQKDQKKYIGIGVVENILFYTMSSVTKENENRILDDIIDLLVEIFYQDDLNKKKEYLKNLYLSVPQLEFEETQADKMNIVTITLIKYKCKIKLERLNFPDNQENLLISEKKERLENLKKLPTFLNALFKINLSCKNEPILLSGNTSYKKELAKEFLKSASVISLNQEITINQLLGSSSFLNKEDSKQFYLKELGNCLKLNNLPSYMNYLKEWMSKEKSEDKEGSEAKKLEFQGLIDKIKNDVLSENYPFKIPVENLYNKLFDINTQNESQSDNNLLNDMIIEFRPGLILSAILGQRSLILVDLPNAKTVVLERFNELFSGKHSLTLNEDIHETFTTTKKKEFGNFTEFRIIATCKKGYENRLSEALLSRFTILSIEEYNQEEEKEVLYIKAKGKKMENDINKLINYSREFQDKFNIEFPLTKMVKCLNLYEQFYKNNKNVDLFFPFYILANGLLEVRSNANIQKLLEIEPNFILPITNILQKVEKNNTLESQFTNLEIFSSNIQRPIYHDEIYFSEKMKEMINVLHTGLCTKIPVILEGFNEQGKSTAIKYLSDYLNLELINVNISKETKVEDLLCQISIEKEENGTIKIKNNETKLLKALKSREQIPKNIIVFQNINNASPAVLETLTSIFGPVNTNILLPNGDIFQKGEVHIFAIFNRQNGISREKLPSSLIHNSLYYIVENPDNDDIREIIATLFKKYNLEKEINPFERYYFDSKKFISEQNNEIPLTLSDIKKYILFRKKCPTVDDFIIIQFIFVYRYYKFKLLEESKKRLGLIDIVFDPEIEYQNNASLLKIKLIPEKKETDIDIQTFNNELINSDLENIINTFNNITLYGKYALIFLVCSVLTERACIIQGENCSGKTFLVRFLSKMFGRKLIEYQMNSNVGMSIFTRDSIINENLSLQDKRKLKELILQIKAILELDENEYNDLSDLKVSQYKSIIKEINSKISSLKEKENQKKTIDLLIKIKKQISLIISPVNQIKYKESDFIRALREGEWVLIEGIESAPNQIVEKLISLCGDNPELNIYETGKGIYFGNKKGEKIEKIHENFHLFITCNPSKESAKRIDKSLFNKCMTFTSPQIDSKVEDAALVLFSRLKNYNKNEQSILLNLSSRLSNFHKYCLSESQINPYDFAGRIPITPNYLLFVSNIFNNSKDEPYKNKIYASLENYWKSISNDSIKEKFKGNSLTKFLEVPFDLKVKQTVLEKLSNVLLIIKTAQELIIKKESKSKFELSILVSEILHLKLNQIDIETVIKNINETLSELEKIPYDSHNYIGKIYQMRIIENILDEVKESISKNKIDSKFYNLSLNSEEIEKINSIKKPLNELKLLKGLIINENLYNQNFKPYIFSRNLITMLNLIQNFIEFENIYSFKNLISFLNSNKICINYLNDIFPYNNKKLSDFSKKFISVIYLLNKKKINFTIRIDEEYKFIYEKEQNDRLQLGAIISKDNFYFDNGTKISCKKADCKFVINKEKKLKPSLEMSKIFLQMTEHFSGVTNITKNEINKQITILMKNPKIITIPKSYFILNNLFIKDVKSSKISKAWALIFNFNKENIFLKYLNTYLLPLESDLLKIIEKQYASVEQNGYDKVISLTNQLISFCDENSILWLDSIGAYTIKNSEIENDKLQIINEINYYEKLNINLNLNFLSYIGRLKEIKSELNKGNEQNEKMERVREKINKIKDRLTRYLNNGKYNQYHRIIRNLKSKVINSYEESEDYIEKLEAETDSLLKSVDNYFSNFEESKHIWPTIKTDNYVYNPEIILFKNLIWYSKIKSVILEIKKEQDIGIKKSLIPKIEKYSEIKPIIDYLEYKLDDSNVSLNDFNFIESHLRNLFLLKLYNENSSDDIINIEYINFEKQINNLISRVDTNENLYKYFCSIANDYSTFDSKFDIIIPKFRPLDLIYLFVLKTRRGCKNGLLLKDSPEISNEKIVKLIENEGNDYIQLINTIAEILIQEKLMSDNIKFQNYDEIMNIIDKNENDKFFICLKTAMKIAKLLSEKNSEPKEELIYDDINEFTNIKKGYNYFITNKDITSNYPSLLYYYCKHKNFTKLLFKKIENYKDLSQNMKNTVENNNNEKYIPFWVICLRILSSVHVIDYDFDKIFEKEMLLVKIRKIISEKIIKKENISNSWINLVLENVPKEISQMNIGIYYNFFNNLSSSIISDCQFSKNTIENIIRNSHIELFNIVFNDESKLPININFSSRVGDRKLNELMLDPNNYILNEIKKEITSLLSNNFKRLKEIISLKECIKNFKDNFDANSGNLNNEIKNENDRGKTEYKKKIEDYNKKILENELDTIFNNYKSYKDDFDKFKKLIKNKREENKSTEDKKIIFRINQSEIEKFKKEKKFIEKYTNKNLKIFKFGRQSIFIKKYVFTLKSHINFKKGKIHIKAENYNDNYSNLEEKLKLYFHNLDKNDIEEFYYERDSEKKELKEGIDYDIKEKSIEFLEILQIFEKEIIFEELVTKYGLTKDPNINVPIVMFNQLTNIQFTSLLNDLKEILQNLLDILKNIEKEFIDEKYNLCVDKINNLSNKISENNIATIDGFDCYKINNIVEVFETDIKNIETKLREFDLKYQTSSKPKLVPLYKLLKEQKIFNQSFKLTIPNKYKKIPYFKFNLDGLKEVDLSVPFISYDNDKNNLEFSSKNFEKVIGPICPNLCGEYIEIKILNSIKNKVIYPSVEDINSILKEDVKMSRQFAFYDNKINVIVEKQIEDGEDLIMKIKIPDLYSDQEETHYYHFNLYLKLEQISGLQNILTIPCRIIIRLIPLSLILISENYNLTAIDKKKLKLNTNIIYEKENLVFKLKNYIGDKLEEFQAKIENLEENEVKEPHLYSDINRGILEIRIPELEEDSNNNFPMLHGILTIAFTEQYKIEIEIKAFVVPWKINMSIYDYTKKKFNDSPTIYYNNDDIKKENFKIPIYLRIESTFVVKPIKANLICEVNNKDIEIEQKDKIIKIGENNVINLELKFKKEFLVERDFEEISLKLNGIDITFENKIKTKFFIKEGEKLTINSITNIAKDFDIYFYDENKKQFEKEDNINNLIDSNINKFNKSVIYSFSHNQTQIKYIQFNFKYPNTQTNNSQSDLPLYVVTCYENIIDNYYYHIDKDGNIKKNKGNDINAKKYYNQRDSNENAYEIALFASFYCEKQKILLDFLKSIEEEVFKDWENEVNNEQFKLKKLEELKNSKKNIENKFKNLKYLSYFDFSDLAFFITKNENLFNYLGNELDIFFIEEERNIYKELKEKINDKEKHIYFDIILFFYKFFKNNRKKFKNNTYFGTDVEEIKLKEECKNLRSNYYIYDQKKAKENSGNLKQIIEQIKKLQKEPNTEKKENIYIIYDKEKPQLTQSELIKKDEQKIVKVAEPDKDNFSGEPPEFKSDLNFNMEFSNIKEIIDFYTKYTSDTNILPLHIIKLIYNEKLNQQEKEELNQNLANRFVKMTLSFKDLDFIKEDKCLINKVINDFKESMNDMLLKFVKGKTNFNELIPNLKLNKKTLNKVYVVEKKPEYKLDIKKWKTLNSIDNNIFAANKILGFQYIPRKEKNKNESNNNHDNYSEVNEIKNDKVENEKDINPDEDKNKTNKIKTIDSTNIDTSIYKLVEKNIVYDDYPKKDEKNNLFDNKDEEEKEKEKLKEKNDQIQKIKAFKCSSEDKKELNNLQNPLDINPNIPETELDEQIKRIIEQIKEIDINSNIKLDNSPKIPHNISEYIKDESKNKENELFNIISISTPISAAIINEISKKNLKEYIPFKELEVNLLIDCSRYISKEGKYFNVILVFGIAMALNALKIKYSIGLVADYEFKIELKTINDAHDNKYFQMLIDSIYCPRLMTHYASCIHYAIENFKTMHKIGANRVFIMISNGLDKELKLRKKWAEKFFNNIKHSFLFLFTEPKFKNKEIIQYLREEIWEPFKNLKDINYSSIVKVMYFEQKIDDKFKKELSKNLCACLSRKLDEEEMNDYIKNCNNQKPKFELENNQLSNEYIENTISNIERIIKSNDYNKFKEPYVKKVEHHYNNIDIRQGDIDVQLYSKHQNKILETKYPQKIIENIEQFTKKFKERKENMNLSSLDIIFPPNLPTQYVLSTKGNIIDMDAFFKYYLNPTPNPMFYKELDGGFIKNYGITVVIDTSISCLNNFASDHYLDTIRILLSILSFSELPSFDLVVTGLQDPIVICSDISTSIALSEKSSIWGSLYASLSPLYYSDLSSAIKVAYDLNNIRRNETTNYIFVITDGLFSLPEQKVILEKVKLCENKGINVFGIGVGICPYGLEKIFTNVIFSQNPNNLIDAIGGFFGQINCPCKEMPHTEIFSNINNIIPSEEAIKDIIEKPEYYKLKEYLYKIKFVPESLPLYNEEDEEELEVNESQIYKEKVYIKPSFSENCLKGQKLLIVMLWNCEMDKTEKKFVDEKYIKEPYNGCDKCIKSLLDYFGVEIKIVKNYIDAIIELTTEDENIKGCCKYFAAMVMNGPNYAVLPLDDKIKDQAEQSRYVIQFLKVLEMFWKNGGGVLLFNENEPFFFQTNLFLKMIKFPGKYDKANFQLYGIHQGGQEMIGNDQGDLSSPGTFTRKRSIIDAYERSIIGHGLSSINEGITLSYTDYDEEKVKPFYIFSRDNEGGVNSLYYVGIEGHGDIIIDNSYTKFLSDLKNPYTAKLVQNMVGWIARIDYHWMNGKDPKLMRPKLVDHKFDPKDKCSELLFKIKTIKKEDALKLKTLIAIDYSGSIKNKTNYHDYLGKKILPLYYKEDRGDSIYIWSEGRKGVKREEIMKIIYDKSGYGGTDSSQIALILKEQINNDFKHLVIVTDGEVPLNFIKKSDQEMKKLINNIKLEFVSIFIIDTGGKVDLSVGAPYCRETANETVYIDKNGLEHPQASLFQEDLYEFNNLEKNENYTQNDFLKNFARIESAVRAKTLGSSSESALNVLNNFKNKILSKGNAKQDFIDKIDSLISFAKEGNKNLSLSIA